MRFLLLILFAGLWLACGGGEDLTEPLVGSLEITTSTSGPELDDDGYAVTIDDSEAGAIGANARMRVDGLTAGRHTVALSGAADNCTAEPTLATVEIVADATVEVSFSIACRATTGAVAVTVSTTPDPGAVEYSVLLDGAKISPIGGNATVTLPGLSPGTHQVGVGGLAAECTVAGENPRAVTVIPGEVAAETFEIECVAASPSTGAVRVTTTTTGSVSGSDGYELSIDGGAVRSIGPNASLVIEGLTPGEHSVALGGLAEGCAVTGDNPRTVTVAADQTEELAFAVTCSPITGRLRVTISGLPEGTDAAVTVTGPDDYGETLTATTTLEGLAPGDYTAAAESVTSGGITYAPSPASRTRTVVAGETVSAAISYSASAGSSLNLRIEALYLTQSTQTLGGDVPLVAGRDGFLRVFVLANETSSDLPSVRVRFYDGGAVATTLTVPPPGIQSTPTVVQEGMLGRSWNVPVPGSLIRPGMALLADVDPSNALLESDETDNSFPASGTPQPLDVRGAPVLRVRLVPVRQSADGSEGRVSGGNRQQFLDVAQGIYPVPGLEGDVRSTYTTSTGDPLEPDDANGAWITILSEIDALRVAEGANRHYYGVVRLAYAFGINGIGFLGVPTALGYDELSDASRVLAHELGHNWNRLHSPCGNPGNVDQAYPYAGGQIGVFGLDVARGALKSRTAPDIMGYCEGAWISDYTYRAVQNYRGTGQSRGGSADAVRPSLLVWGRIVDGRAELEPALQLVTRPSLPTGPGPYSVEGVAVDGSSVFSLSFDAVPVADHPRDARHFAFAVPLDEARAARLGSLRLTGPGVAMAARSSAAAVRGAGVGADSVVARRTARGVTVRWDASAHPMVMVRDPQSGEILSFGRGGAVEVLSGGAELDVVASDGVRSRRIRLPVAGR